MNAGEKNKFRASIINITSLLIPPATGLIVRGRSLSNASSRSRPGTPVSSSTTSTPHGATNLSPRSSEVFERHPFPRVMTIASGYLTPHDILAASLTTRECHNLRTSLTFHDWLESNGWDTNALVRRTDEAKNTKGRPWLHMAKSAVHKAEILTRFHALLDFEKSYSKDKYPKKPIEKFMRILVDVVTEHDRRNFPTLNALARTLNMTFLQFVAKIPAYDWKLRYRKTFLMAAFVNAKELYPEIEQDLEQDLEKVVESLNFGDVSTSPAFLAAHANFLYSYACITYADTTPLPLPSFSYDPPHQSLSSRSFSVPGLRQAIDRFRATAKMKGTYRRTNGDQSKMTMAFGTGELSKKLHLPFSDKHHLALTAEVTDGEGNPSWQMEGSINSETGRGNVKSQKGMIYDLWITPWGLVGEKLMGERHLGYFVLQWT